MPPDFDENNASSDLAGTLASSSSVDDFTALPEAGLARTGMNRSASEYAFREFLREHESKLAAADPDENVANEEQREPSPRGTLPQLFSISEESAAAESEDGAAGPVQNAPGLNPLFRSLHHGPGHDTVDPQQYESYLKKRLEVACAAVALARASKQNKDGGSSMNSDGDPLGIPALPPKPELSERRLFGTSGSSHSEDDEADTELSIVDSTSDPSVKRIRRMLSNRESARRSRRRKQAHMSDLEMQVAHLRVENSSLLKKLDEVNKNYNEAAVDNRVLKSDVEALSAKVKMAEDVVSRAAANGSLFPHRPRPQQQQGAGNKMNRTPSMQRVASLEHLQKRIRAAQPQQSSISAPVPAAAPRNRKTAVPPVAEYDDPAPSSST